MPDAIDALHNAVVEAKERTQDGTEGPLSDAWDASIDPNAVVRAQNVPLFRAEIERVKKQIAEVRILITRLLDFPYAQLIGATARWRLEIQS